MDARAILQELVECILAHQPAPLTDRKAAQRELKAYEAARAYLAQPVAVPHDLVARLLDEMDGAEFIASGARMPHVLSREAAAHITAQAAENERLAKIIETLHGTCRHYEERLGVAEPDAKRLRAALRQIAELASFIDD